MNAPAHGRVVSEWSARGRPFEAAGVASRVWEAGPADGPSPVVCLHGVPASSFIYRKLLHELALRDRRAIAFDLPGLGLAARPAGFDYRWSGLATWMAAALDALGLREDIHLVVHDIGGPIGFEVVRRAPARIGALTVLDTIVRVASFRRPWSMQPFAIPGLRRLWLASLTRPAFRALMRMQGMGPAVPNAEIDAYVELLKREDGGAAFLKIMAGFERTEAFEAGILAALRERAFPAQVLWGRDDPALPADVHGEHGREALGLEAVRTVPGKHFVMEDAPAEIAAAIVALGSG